MYDVGDVNVLSVLVTDANNNPANCTAIALTVTAPDGSTSSPSVSNPATGTYTANFTITQAGEHSVSWVGTGANAAAFTDTFYAQAFYSVVSLADAKAFLNLTSTTNDEELRGIIVAANTALESYTNLLFTKAPYVRTYSGSRLVDRISLPQFTSAITSVTENGVSLVAGTDYALNVTTGVLLRRGGPYWTWPWSPGYDNIVITGVGGSTTVPADVRLACLLLVRHMWETQRGPSQGFSPGGIGSDSYDPVAAGAMPRRIQEMLRPYVSAGFA